MFKWFLNTKISQKLLLCFLAMALIAGSIGAVGVTSVRQMEQESTSLYEENAQELVLLGQASVHFQRIRFQSLRLLLVSSSEQNETISTISEYSALLETDFQDISAIMTSDEERAALAALSESWSEYSAYIDQAVRLAQTGLAEQAESILLTQAKSIGDTIRTDLETLVDNSKLEAESHAKDNQAVASRSVLVIIATSVAGLVLAIVFGICNARIIGAPLSTLAKAAELLSVGDVNMESLHLTQKEYDLKLRKDEVGHLALAYNKLMANTKEQVEAAGQVAVGDLTAQIIIRSEQDLLGKGLSSLVDSLDEIAISIHSAAEQVNSGAAVVSNTSMALSQGATEQASSVEELTASLEEVSSQTALNAQSAKQADLLVRSIKQSADSGSLQMRDMLGAMEEISRSSNDINKIIKVIDDIAFQTNILALNAAVEAARAGQQGRGFAVVAEEVRALAARSANAAKETTALIAGSIQKVAAGTGIADSTAKAFNQIVDEVDQAAQLVGAIAASSAEQAAGIEQINEGINQVSQVVQTNAATSEECAAASEELNGQAEKLKELIGFFKTKQSNAPAQRKIALN